MNTQKSCTQCGSCLNTCPVFLYYKSEEFSPKAKHQLLRKGWMDDGDIDWQKMMQLAGQCACCERCKSPCARKLSVPEALSQARARHPRWQQYFWKEWVAKGGVLWSVASHLAPLVPNAALPRRLGILHAAALAMKSPQEPQPWLRLKASAPQSLRGKAFVIFGGCTGTRLRDRWMQKAEGILHRLGAEVPLAGGFSCCGGTYAHAGIPDSAQKAAVKNVAYWRQLGKPAVAVFCASCMHSLRQYAQMEGVLDEEEKKAWLAALLPLSTLLTPENTEAMPQAPVAYAYHSPCHWGTSDPDQTMLKKLLPGLRKGGFPCCGFGGVLKMLNPDLSRNLAEMCWKGLECASDGSHLPVVTGCSGCSMQLLAHAPEKAVILHWLDVWQQ